MGSVYISLLSLTFYLMHTRAMMMRNDALISKMVSNFQKDNTLTLEATPQGEIQPQTPKNVLSLMQSVLCKNFPTIPCDMIVEDSTLRTLIERSIQQLKFKKMSMEKTTSIPGYHLTLFPTINSEDLSNFLQVSDTGYYSSNNARLEKMRGRKHKKKILKNPIEEKVSKKRNSKNKDSIRASHYPGHKKIRKFYPHKIKYKDKTAKAQREAYREYSEEKLSMSVEAPEMNAGRKRMSGNYDMEPSDPPVWRIDYMKHGEPSLNMFAYEPDRLNEKLVKTGPNVIVAESLMEQAPRKDVLHPDVYIKKNFIRKNVLAMNSGGID